jgi:DNA-binding transcriptional ArsR family regulator
VTAAEGSSNGGSESSRASGLPRELDEVWKALSDATRREILDYVRDGPRTTTEIVVRFPHLSRFGVMKHMDVLRAAGLLITNREGRRSLNSLNAALIRQIVERWISKYEAFWANSLLRIKEAAEEKQRGRATDGGDSA